MSEISFKSQETPAQEPAQASGSQQQQQDPQVVIAELSARLKDLESKHGVTQKRVDDSQEYIKQLKSERDAALEAANKARKLDDVYSALKEEPRAQPVADRPPSVDVEDLRKLAREEAVAIAQAEKQKALEEANFKLVADQLSAKFGDDVDKQVKALAEDIGVSVEHIANMAKQNPKAVLKMFPDVKPQPQPFSPTKQSFNSNKQAVNVDKEPDFKTQKDQWVQWKRKQVESQLRG